MARTNQEAVIAFGEVLRLTNSAYSHNAQNRNMSTDNPSDDLFSGYETLYSRRFSA